MLFYSATARTGREHLEEDYPITTFYEHRRFWSFFCQWTNGIHKFEGCFLRGQVCSNDFKGVTVA